MEARLIRDPALPGAWNMAADEALLAAAHETGQTCLRFYAWSAPTLSLGYFQAAADRARHPASAAAQLVRRSTGGGAIVHHFELTYSFTCPAGPRSAAVSQQYYHAFHETAIEMLTAWGISAKLAAEESAGDAPPFLCFQRRAAGDVVVGKHKVLGSAQRRHQQGLLQHGSLLLDTSPHAPELPGLNSLAPLALNSQVVIERWVDLIAARLGVQFYDSQWSTAEQQRATRLERSKFSDKGWTERR